MVGQFFQIGAGHLFEMNVRIFVNGGLDSCLSWMLDISFRWRVDSCLGAGHLLDMEA